MDPLLLRFLERIIVVLIGGMAFGARTRKRSALYPDLRLYGVEPRSLGRWVGGFPFQRTRC